MQRHRKFDAVSMAQWSQAGSQDIGSFDRQKFSNENSGEGAFFSPNCFFPIVLCSQ